MMGRSVLRGCNLILYKPFDLFVEGTVAVKIWLVG
jgi:hypothetical protein